MFLALMVSLVMLQRIQIKTINFLHAFHLSYRNKLKELSYVRSISERGKYSNNSPIKNCFSQRKEECLRIMG